MKRFLFPYKNAFCFKLDALSNKLYVFSLKICKNYISHEKYEAVPVIPFISLDFAIIVTVKLSV